MKENAQILPHIVLLLPGMTYGAFFFVFLEIKYCHIFL